MIIQKVITQWNITKISEQKT